MIRIEEEDARTVVAEAEAAKYKAERDTLHRMLQERSGQERQTGRITGAKECQSCKGIGRFGPLMIERFETEYRRFCAGKYPAVCRIP